jgi:very-short-patch-repair endonuclease
MANERARSLRHNSTNAERRLWYFLRGLKPQGYKFRRQVPVDQYIVDFACLSARLIIEVDGDTTAPSTKLRMTSSVNHTSKAKDFVSCGSGISTCITTRKV